MLLNRTRSLGALEMARPWRSVPLLCCALALAAPVAAETALDWSKYAAERVVVVTTTDPDGDVRTTKAWLAVWDGNGYLRTSGTRWGDNLERNPEIQLQVGAETLALRVRFVRDEALRSAVKRAFREKYGFADRAINVFRSRHPRILLLESRPAD